MTDARADDLAALRLLDEPARRRLYDWVAGQDEPVGREQAAAATGLSRALATFHLDKLADAGLLEASYRRLTGRVGPGAGRPARVYRRADREFSVTVPERRYANAADLFASALERIGGGGPPAELREAAHEMGRRLSSGTRGRSRSGRTRLIRALESGGYEPVTDSLGHDPPPQLPVRRPDRRASAARVRHEPGARRGHRRRGRGDRIRAGPRHPAGPLLRHVSRTNRLTALTWPAGLGRDLTDPSR